jgi:Predicted integral membrane protein (DUF2270)
VTLTLRGRSDVSIPAVGDRIGRGIVTSNGRPGDAARELSAAELEALAHLYRSEVYRSTIWRTRLDTTTNWAVVTFGVALSLTFESRRGPPPPHPPAAPPRWLCGGAGIPRIAWTVEIHG